MSDDLINKKEALNLLRKRSQQLVGIYGDLGGAVSGAARLIDEFPSADRPQDFWIIRKPEEEGFGAVFQCSRCGCEVDCTPTNFCPNCGADMRKGADDEH